MDYLRRLAPLSETDSGRAVAVLPPRFAGKNPLQETSSQGHSAPQFDVDEPQQFSKTGSVAVANHVSGAKSDRVPDMPSYRTESSMPSPAPSSRDMGTASGSTEGDNEIATIDSDAANANSKPFDNLVQSPRAQMTQAVSAPHTQSRNGPPLSQNSLAHRTLISRDDNQIVHVSIGRIDVVANTASAPAPAVRRSAAPRKPTVALGDYLRSGNKQ